MSGICGIVRFNRYGIEQNELELMVRPAIHRGVGAINYHINELIGIACLSRDTTVDGSGDCLPLEDRACKVVFAADVRLDNRQSLEKKPAPVTAFSDSVTRFQRDNFHSDAELMLGILLQDKDLSPECFVGDFAYALWDARREELHLARDAMGMRSLYYRVEAGRFLFATEIAQILAVHGVQKKLNDQTVAWYLAGMQVPAGNTFYKDIHEVRPGEEVVIDRHGRVRQRYFWRPDPEHRIRYRDEREYAEHLRELLIEATRCRLRSHSPVGISLSGGMDSGSVASVCGWLREQQERVPSVRTYSWAFRDFPHCDERHLSRLVAERFQFPVHEIPDTETYPLTDPVAILPHADDPFTSIYHGYLRRVISTAHSEGVGTMLFGFRGDVMVGGEVFDVPGLLSAGLFRSSRRELAALRRMHGGTKGHAVAKFAVGPMIGGLMPGRALALAGQGGRCLSSAGKQSADAVRFGPAARAAGHVRADFLKRAGLPWEDPVGAAAKAFGNPAVCNRFEHIFSSLVMRVMQFSERLCAEHRMAFADVWSDRRIAEFVLACPQHLIHRASEPKRLARLAMRGIMPNEVINKARKVSPEALYFGALRGPAYTTVIDLMTDSRCAELGYVDEAMLRRRFNDYIQGTGPCDDIWPMLSLELWLRQYWS